MPPPRRIPDQWMDAKTFEYIEHFEIGSFKAKLRTDRDQIIKLQSSKVKKGKKIIEKNKHHYTNKYRRIAKTTRRCIKISVLIISVIFEILLNSTV